MPLSRRQQRPCTLTYRCGGLPAQRALNCNLSELLSPLRKYVVMSSTSKKYINKYDPTAPEVIAAR
jgi:hypothetical protein